jgi:hypothetical protein
VSAQLTPEGVLQSVAIGKVEPDFLPKPLTELTVIADTVPRCQIMPEHVEDETPLQLVAEFDAEALPTVEPVLIVRDMNAGDGLIS